MLVARESVVVAAGAADVDVSNDVKVVKVTVLGVEGVDTGAVGTVTELEMLTIVLETVTSDGRLLVDMDVSTRVVTLEDTTLAAAWLVLAKSLGDGAVVTTSEAKVRIEMAAADEMLTIGVDVLNDKAELDNCVLDTAALRVEKLRGLQEGSGGIIGPMPLLESVVADEVLLPGVGELIGTVMLDKGVAASEMLLVDIDTSEESMLDAAAVRLGPRLGEAEPAAGLMIGLLAAPMLGLAAALMLEIVAADEVLSIDTGGVETAGVGAPVPAGETMLTEPVTVLGPV